MPKTEKDNTQKHCNHFVIRKKRYCRMLVKSGEEFCGEHQQIQSCDLNEETANDKNNKIRVVCPLDRKHTCYAYNLKKHIKICNARQKDVPSYIRKGINSGQMNNNEVVVDSGRLLSSFDSKEILRVIDKIHKIYEEHIKGKITEKLLEHAVVEKEMAKPECGIKIKKHLKQASGILGILDENNLIKSNTCYIEFGAGRGQLSYWLAQATDSLENTSFLLIERSSPKHKHDNKLDKSESKVQRIRADIADLLLDKLDFKTNTNGIVAVTKHLCGDATDLALRCLSNFSMDQIEISGCLMTFCCLHRCRWIPYTGKMFFEEMGLTEIDFEIMRGMSGWAVCGSGFSRDKIKIMNDKDEKEVFAEKDNGLGLNRMEKAEIGNKAKCIVNWGRLRYLEQLGFNCALHYYVPSDVSPENVCVVAYKNKSK